MEKLFYVKIFPLGNKKINRNSTKLLTIIVVVCLFLMVDPTKKLLRDDAHDMKVLK